MLNCCSSPRYLLFLYITDTVTYCKVNHNVTIVIHVHIIQLIEESQLVYSGQHMSQGGSNSLVRTSW